MNSEKKRLENTPAEDRKSARELNGEELDAAVGWGGVNSYNSSKSNTSFAYRGFRKNQDDSK